ncbi:GTP cyclohydrolase [Mycobacterium phage Saguaro]|uniref:GTP cyclohydrolase I n=1 Tax=Mycobacterium phage Saguaro TaxID=2315616 RepID=A0A386K9D2_9CAUD|nr:GTP cyclohydrolase [Mycobacterium phage Saguaro]AYD82001.1 GTP cyclohydrolase I [Mycobacterium phage Saguaro]
MIDVDNAALAVKDLLQAFGVPIDDHTADTPTRSARAWAAILAGYQENPADHLSTTFSAPDDPGLVLVSGIRIQSMCAHHLLPFSGVATVAYRPSPGQRIVGISKLARVIQGYARRLQVQEQIGYQTVSAIKERLNPSAAVCQITAVHDCMRLRGVQEPSAATTTVASQGLVLDHEWALIDRQHSQHL